MKKLSEKDEELRKAATSWVRRSVNKNLVKNSFLDIEKYPSSSNPLIFFMAGSPGAGKTEVSKELIKQFNEQPDSIAYARIDPDEIRDLLPGYNKKNAYIFQQPISIVMDDLLSIICKTGQSAIIDGTLANYESAKKNIQKVIKANGVAAIIYIYQDPILAWNFTQEREALEGRRIEKEAFIRAFYSSKSNVNKLKNEFGNDLNVFLVEKDYKKQIKKFRINIVNIDDYVKIPYTQTELENML